MVMPFHLTKAYQAAGPLQDIVTAHEHFNMDGFMGQFQTALQVTSPKKRMFLLDWMGVSLPSSHETLLQLRWMRAV